MRRRNSRKVSWLRVDDPICKWRAQFHPNDAGDAEGVFELGRPVRGKDKQGDADSDTVEVGIATAAYGLEALVRA